MGDHSAKPAAAGQRIAILTRGANFRATLKLGTLTKTIPQPPTGILPGAILPPPLPLLLRHRATAALPAAAANR